MASLDPSFVPNLLVKSWAKVGAWIDLPEEDQNRANIASVVRNEIVPTANFYAKQLNNQLIALGCAPPEVVVEMGEEN